MAVKGGKMNYQIVPFLLMKYENFSVLQNYNNIMIIKDNNMIEFLSYIDVNNIFSISQEEIVNFFRIEQSSEIIRDLIDNNIIIEIKKKDLNFSKFIICSNDMKFIESMKFNTSDITYSSDYIFLSDKYDVESICFDKDNIYFFFLNKFNYKYFSNLVGRLQKENVICKIAFFYNSRIYISNYYRKNWYSPCPICYFSHIKAMVNGHSKINASVSYQTILELIYDIDDNYGIEYSFKNHEILKIVNVFLEDMVAFPNVNENEVISIDVKRNLIEYDNAVHWELCDCYE